MTRHWGVLLDWTVVDFAFLGIAVQQYISISRDLKRSRAQASEGRELPHDRPTQDVTKG
jgi:hypothetical protein